VRALAPEIRPAYAYPAGDWCPLSNTWDNPFVDNRNAFLANAGCWDDDTITSYPTTCMTTVP